MVNINVWLLIDLKVELGLYNLICYLYILKNVYLYNINKGIYICVCIFIMFNYMLC